MVSYQPLWVLAAVAAAFGLLFFPLASRVAPVVISPYPKASPKKRLAAAALDAIVCAACAGGFTVAGSVPLLVLAALYALLKDGLCPGSSLGKLVAGLIVVSLDDGKPCDLRRSVRRNGFFVVPGLNAVALIFETISLLRDRQGMRLGDRFAQTQVVEGHPARELLRALQQRLLRDIVRLNQTKEEEPHPTPGLGSHGPQTTFVEPPPSPWPCSEK